MSGERRSLPRLVAGAGLAGPVAFLAYRRGALDGGGALATGLVGSCVFAGGGLAWAVPMLGFFVTASSWTRLHLRRTSTPASQRARAARTARQVAANGGLAALLGVLQLRAAGRHDLSAAYAGAVAAAAADTWATELGALSPSPPRSPPTGRPVPHGTSGAVTLLGTVAMVGGATLVALLAPRGTPRGAVVVAGCAGALADSLLGATLQARYRCTRCGRLLEDPRHDCPGPVRRVSGLPGLTNDAVNALATLVGAATAWLLTRVSRGDG